MSGKFIALLLLVFSLLILSCSDDSSNEDFGTISGTVTFVGSWPATGDVQVSAWSSWPPAGPPSAASIEFTSGVNPQDFTIEGLSKGTYQVITVGWRDPLAAPAGEVLGIYWAETDSLNVLNNMGEPSETPVQIVISSDQLDWDNIDIIADLDIVPSQD